MSPRSSETMYEEIMEVSDKIRLTDWETDFLEDIEQDARDNALTPRQHECLVRIYDKACKSEY